MNTINRIAEHFKLLRIGLEGDIEAYELIVKMREEYARTLEGAVRALFLDSGDPQQPILYTSRLFVDAEKAESEVFVTFVREGPLQHLKDLHRKVSADEKKLHTRLKKVYTTDKALYEKIRAGKDIETTKRERAASLQKAAPLIDSSIEKAVEAIMSAIDLIENEYRQLHYFLRRYVKNQYEEFECPIFLETDWENVNFRAFRDIFESEIASCEVNGEGDDRRNRTR